MKNLPVPSLGSLSKSANGLYPHINDRYINGGIIKAIADRVKKAKSNHLLSGAPLCDIVGCLTGYETIYNANGAAGYCDWENKQIAVALMGNNILLTVCHEISHSIQVDLGLMEGYGSTISWHVKMERQCETMAYYLYNGIFEAKSVHWSLFNAYTTKESILWLADWYKGYVENDLSFKS